MTAVCVIIEVEFREEAEDCLDLRYFRAFMIGDDRRCQVWRAQRAWKLLLLPAPYQDYQAFDLDLISTLLIRTRRISCLISCITCILFPSGCSPCSAQDMPAMWCSSTFSLSGSHRCDDKHTHTLFGQHWPLDIIILASSPFRLPPGYPSGGPARSMPHRL